MAPIVHGLEAEYYGRVEFVYLDIDDPDTAFFKDILPYYGAVPQFLLVNGEGRIIRQWFGEVRRETLQEALDEALQP